MEDSRHTPLSMAVFVSVIVVALMVAVAGGIGGSYLLALSAIHREEVTQAYIRQRAATLQIRQAVPTCQAINKMDDASHIPASEFPPPPHNIYDKRLSAAIHAINVNSHCPIILRGVAEDESWQTIMRQIRGNGSATPHRNASPPG